MSNYLNFQISAQFDSFFVYSSSTVFKGETGTTPGTSPTIIPELQNKSVISVAYGYSNYGLTSYFNTLASSHFGALTSSGKLLTWGKYSSGALGFGDLRDLPPGGYAEGGQVQAHVRTYFGTPPEVTVPSEVRFDFRLRAEGRVERYCFATAVGERHMGAIVVDLAGDEVPLEDLEQQI